MNGKIELLGMHFFARHGCFESERLEGNEFVVDFTCEYDIYHAGHSDELIDTIDYGKVYSIIAREMETPSNLLEHVVCRLADALQEELIDLKHFCITVSKKNPPVGGDCEWAKVSLTR